MKFIIASDIHGCAGYAEKLIETCTRHGVDTLALLGDILYHGPRNGVPAGYNPTEVVDILSAFCGRIIAVRGNCDAEIDDMLLPFPILSDYACILTQNGVVYLSHGHRAVPKMKAGDIYATGHTHVPHDYTDSETGVRFVNPGSVSLPKENSAHSVILYEDGKLTWIDIEAE